MFRVSKLKVLPLVFFSLISVASAASLGKNPAAGLVEGTDGALYGTTSNGGTNDLGTVFRIDPNGLITTLINFTGTAGANPGAIPLGPLVFGNDGKLYGTTSEGGANDFGARLSRECQRSYGTALYFGTGPGDGANPKGKLIQGADGNYYGMTSGGADLSLIFGTIFRITPNGSETVLFKFTGAEGAFPTGGLVQGRNGNFYGVAFAGGDHGIGTIFKVDPLGTLTLLYSFSGESDGSNPQGELVEDPTNVGIFYGIASNGGDFGYGTVYKVDTAAMPVVPVTLAAFDGSTLGANPHSSLALGTDGFLYGTTFTGGTNNLGTVFKT